MGETTATNPEYFIKLPQQSMVLLSPARSGSTTLLKHHLEELDYGPGNVAFLSDSEFALDHMQKELAGPAGTLITFGYLGGKLPSRPRDFNTLVIEAEGVLHSQNIVAFRQALSGDAQLFLHEALQKTTFVLVVLKSRSE